MRTLAVVSIMVAGVAGAALGGEVSRSATVEASPAEVWEVIGPFCSIQEWHPAIETCTEEEVGGKPHRRLATADGAAFLEERLSDENDAGMSYSYAIIESPLPVSGYESTLSVGESDGKATVTWESSFEADGVPEQEAEGIVGGIYDAGLKAVQDRFAK